MMIIMCSMREDDGSDESWKPRSRGRYSANLSWSLAQTACSVVLIARIAHSMARNQRSWMIHNQSSKKSKQHFKVWKKIKIRLMKSLKLKKKYQELNRSKVMRNQSNSC